jgi:hypothetical protein
MGKRKGIDYSGVKEVANEVAKVSKTLGMTNTLTEKIVVSQFDFIRYIIERGDFETVRFPYIGKFSVSDKRLYYINKIDRSGTVKDRKRGSGTGLSGSGNGEGVQKDTDQG